MRSLLVAAALCIAALPLIAQDMPLPERYNGDKNNLPVTLKAIPGMWSNFTLAEKLRCHKDDTRTDIRQIGVKPALVMLVQIPTAPKNSADAAKKDMTNCLLALRQAEALSMRYPDIEVWVLLASRDVVPTPDAMRGAGIKQIIVAIPEMGYTLCEHVPGLRFCYMQHAGNAAQVARAGDDKSTHYYYEWIWMPRPAQVHAAGDELDDQRIGELVKKMKEDMGPVLKDRKARQFVEAAAYGQYKQAGKLVGELRAVGKSGKPLGTEDLLELIAGLVTEIEAVLRESVIDRGIKDYYFAEAAESLEAIVELNRSLPRADEVTKELAAVKAKPEYKACVEARPVFEKLKKKWAAVVVPFGERDSVKEHYEKILKAYGPLRPEIEDFQKKYRSTGYQNDVAQWVTKLNDADTRYKKAVEEGR